MILPVLERISGSVTFWCGFGAKAMKGFVSGDSLKTSAGPLSSLSFCGFTMVNIAGAAASSTLFHWSCRGELVAAGWTWESASALTVCNTRLTRESVDWLAAQTELGSDGGAAGCRGAALDLRRLLKTGAQFFFFSSFVFCLSQSCSSLDLIAVSDFPEIRNGRKEAFQHKSHVTNTITPTNDCPNSSLWQCLKVVTAKVGSATNWFQHRVGTVCRGLGCSWPWLTGASDQLTSMLSFTRSCCCPSHSRCLNSEAIP